MTKVFESNADLPRSLSTEAKQKAKARALAEAHLGTASKKARGPRMQVPRWTTGSAYLHICEQARKYLGPAVPAATKLTVPDLEEDGIWTCFMTYIPGETLAFAQRDWDGPMHVKSLKSLARLLARGFIPDSVSRSALVVDRDITPKLQKLLEVDRAPFTRFRGDIERLLGKVHLLKQLPLFISHYDLNGMNIIAQSDGEISGIVDWELAAELPFGMACCRIHDLAGYYDDGEFHVPEYFEEAERGFWQEIFANAPDDTRKVLNANLEAVQTSVAIGMILFMLDLDSDLDDAPGIRAIPKFLSYRLPALRGEGPPYLI
ncbi:MAG: hypothetical protein M4579_006060 [Chaenotheca gracillima]|nr:MAG: hypothetical protein M4579_006060 [Chaenotheca gracillima]